jgi:hypothetical protein
MFYNFRLLALTYGAEIFLSKTTLQVTHGILHKVDIVFPSGCHGWVGVRIYDNTHQILPTNLDEWFTADNETITFREHFPILTEPYELYAQVYNVDTLFPHTVILRLGILPVRVLAPWLLSYDERTRAALGSD